MEEFAGRYGLRLSSFIAAADGRIILAGQDPYGLLVAALDSSAGVLWQRRYAAQVQPGNILIVQTVDGGYIVGAMLLSVPAGPNSEVYLLKLSPNGTAEWAKSYVLANRPSTWIRAIRQAPDSGYIASGVAYGSDQSENIIWWLKTDRLGNLQDGRTYSAPGYAISPFSAGSSSQGEILPSGYLFPISNPVPSSALLVAIDASGRTQWGGSY